MFKTKSNITQFLKDVDKAGKNILKPFRIPITGLIYQDQTLKNYKSDILTTEYSVTLETNTSSMYFEQIVAPYVPEMRQLFIDELKQVLKPGDTITREVIEKAVDRTMAELYVMLFEHTPIDTQAFRDSWTLSATNDN